MEVRHDAFRNKDPAAFCVSMFDLFLCAKVGH